MLFPSCFRNPTADHQRRRPSLVTCTYRTALFNSPTLLSLTWSKTPSSHTLTLHSPDLFSFTISLSSPPLSLFRARPGSKTVGGLKVYWDFTRAEFERVDSPESGSGFYLALARDGRVEFFIGDRVDELTRRVGSVRAGESTQVSRREHVFGRRRYAATARFSESRHEVEIDIAGGTMKVRIDGKTGLVVRRLGWKFRGSERILIGGLEVDFSWDVFDWVSGGGDGNGEDDRKRSGNGGHGVFVFQVGGGGGPLPEMVGPEKKLMGKRSAPLPATAGGVVSPAPSWSSSVSQWAEESGDGGRSSGWGSNSNSSESWGGGGGGGSGGGYSLVLYAWRRE